MLRDSEIREDWAAITIAVKQSQEYLRHHDGGWLLFKMGTVARIAVEQHIWINDEF